MSLGEATYLILGFRPSASVALAIWTSSPGRAAAVHDDDGCAA